MSEWFGFSPIAVILAALIILNGERRRWRNRRARR